MPYLVQHRKDKLDRGLLPTTPGDLTYLVTKALLGPRRERIDAINAAIKAYRDRRTENFALFAEILGALTAASMEYSRRNESTLPADIRDVIDTFYAEVVAPYEDNKIAVNGDVY